MRDQSRLFLDNDPRSGSLTNLWRKLQADPAIKEHYRERYGHMFDHFHDEPISDLPPESTAVFQEKFRQSDRDENYSRFDSGWEKVSAAMALLMADPVAEKIKTLRDKHHAHLEMRKLDEEPGAFDINTLGLTFNEVLAFGDRCQAIVAELGLLLTGTSWDPQQYASVHEAQGKAMWKTLAGV
ncbi:hypothetical protein D3C71_1529300 [compost metagenome]